MKTQSPFLNYLDLPAWIVASTDFNDRPQPLSIMSVRALNQRFFNTLDKEPSIERRGEIFHEYMSVKFALHQWESHQNVAGSCLRNSYIRFLRGWGVDSNSIEGAVLKSWVHSRFGIPPTYHKGRLPREIHQDGYAFAVDRMKGHARTNAIDSQLDLLFEFCQYELERRFSEQTHFTLYRGTHDAEEYSILEILEKRNKIILLNNLSSFTCDREKAWEFGSTVWTVQVPKVKVFFFSELLPSSLLKGEDEYLVVGGAYKVRELLY